MFMADTQGVQVTGVEINENRANVMRNLLKKYGLEEKVRVVMGDAVKYDPGRKFDRVLVDA